MLSIFGNELITFNQKGDDLSNHIWISVSMVTGTIAQRPSLNGVSHIQNDNCCETFYIHFSNKLNEYETRFWEKARRV